VKKVEYKFEAGDKIQMKVYCSNRKQDSIWTLAQYGSELQTRIDENGVEQIGGCTCRQNWILISPASLETMEETAVGLTVLSQEQKEILSDREQALIEFGVTNDKFQLTEKGKNALLAFLFKNSKESFADEISNKVLVIKKECAKRAKNK
jgi:hypothetical protein